MGDYHSRSHEHDKKFWPRCFHLYNLHYNKYKNIIVKVKLVKKLKIIPQNNNNNIFSIKKYKIMSMIRDMGTAYSMIMSFTLCPYYTNHFFLKNFNSNPWLYLYIKSLSSFKVQNRSSNLLVLRILLCYVQYLKWVFRCSVFEQVILFFATLFSLFLFFKILGSIFWKMYAETGLIFPYMQNFSQDFQLLEEYCKSNKPNSSMVLLVLALFCSLFMCSHIYSVLVLDDLHSFHWF